MADELVRRGHDVTVFAPGNSKTTARLLSTLDEGYHHDLDIWDWQLAEFMQVGLAYEHADSFDVIHSHVYIYALPFSRLTCTPTVHTFHISPTPDFVRFCERYPEGHYVLLSRAQGEFFQFAKRVPVAGVVHNGIDTGNFRFGSGPGEYLAFLGDMRADKGPLEAIHCARDAGVPIKLAGPQTKYFQDVIKPLIDNRRVCYVGEVDHAGKVELLSGALATLFFPWHGEACPLVILESMACGTPVLGIESGPVPELITDEVTGFLVKDVSDMVRAVERVPTLNRELIRKTAVAQFDVTRMVDDYLAIYTKILQARS